MKKEGFVQYLFSKSWHWRDFAEPLFILPYVFWILYLINNGFNWITIVLGAVLFFVVLPIAVFWCGERR
ncbi:MAG TPA: hypothetical protein VI612_03735 [Candidatus Nanoarchaeia archaeon]|nr:hypothetical protein [Candidatus Nanoarchaeia archaeon]